MSTWVHVGSAWCLCEPRGVSTWGLHGVYVDHVGCPRGVYVVPPRVSYPSILAMIRGVVVGPSWDHRLVIVGSTWSLTFPVWTCLHDAAGAWGLHGVYVDHVEGPRGDVEGPHGVYMGFTWNTWGSTWESGESRWGLLDVDVPPGVYMGLMWNTWGSTWVHMGAHGVYVDHVGVHAGSTWNTWTPRFSYPSGLAIIT